MCRRKVSEIYLRTDFRFTDRQFLQAFPQGKAEPLPVLSSCPLPPADFYCATSPNIPQLWLKLQVASAAGWPTGPTALLVSHSLKPHYLLPTRIKLALQQIQIQGTTPKFCLTNLGSLYLLFSRVEPTQPLPKNICFSTQISYHLCSYELEL